MQQPGADTWSMPDGLEVEALLAALKADFGLDIAPEYTARVTYADSFDWLLYQQGYLLHNHGRCWTLYHGDSGEVTVQRGGPELSGRCFARDFPPGPLRDLLEPLLGIRCLLPLAPVGLQGRQIRLLNRDDKTVARLVVESQRPAGDGSVFRLIRLFGIRGYDQDQEVVRRHLEQLGVAENVSPLLGFQEGCRAMGRRPLDYSSKFSVQLEGTDPARRSMARIYQLLLENVSRNIPGVLGDWDTEFLHDLRVAIRRTRSGLSLVRKVFPEATVVRFSREFGRLGRLTGPTRDLDVYLLMEEAYLNRLPPALQPGLRDFFVALRRRRQLEQKKLVRVLRSKKTMAVLDAWQRTLAQADRQAAPRADMPVQELAGRIVTKRFKRVLRDGQALHADSPDADVHRLRIQCKKLRYAMEFFGSLYPRQEMQQLVRHLKKLQEILGDFNDLSVQQDMLRSALAALRGGSAQTLATAAALGGLMQSLFQEQHELRSHFVEAFEQFGDPETMALFHQLFRRHEASS